MSIRGYWRLVRSNRNFRRLWFAQVVSELGDWFYALAIYSLLLELTGSAAAVAWAVVLQVLPQTLAGPITGVVNDRASRKKVMIAADLARAAIVLGMLAVRTQASVWLIWPLLFLETVMAAFFEPARNAVIPNITSPEELMAANTLSSTTWSFNLAIGATLGGLVAAVLGRDAVFGLNAVSFLASAMLIRGMRFTEPHMEGRTPMRVRDLADFSPVVDGIRYIAGDKRVLATVFAKFGLGLMGSNNVILPILGQRVFPVDWPGLTPQRGAMLGMSLLMGGAWRRFPAGPLHRGRMERSARVAAAHGNPHRIPGRGGGLCGARAGALGVDGDCRGGVRTCGVELGMGLLHHAIADVHGRQIQGPRFLRRCRAADPDHFADQLRRREPG